MISIHDLATKSYHVTQFILHMWSCDQSLVRLAFLSEIIITSIL